MYSVKPHSPAYYEWADRKQREANQWQTLREYDYAHGVACALITAVGGDGRPYYLWDRDKIETHAKELREKYGHRSPPLSKTAFVQGVHARVSKALNWAYIDNHFNANEVERLYVPYPTSDDYERVTTFALAKVQAGLARWKLIQKHGVDKGIEMFEEAFAPNLPI